MFNISTLTNTDKRKKGHPHTEETKTYLREINIGKPSWAKGKRFSNEHRQKMSESAKKNPTKKWSYERWMAELPKIICTAIKYSLNKTSQPYNNHSWKKLRRRVYQRDQFICQECLVRCVGAVRISCHHIDFDKNNNEISNLITLCCSCHGKTTQKPDEWIEYYQDKMMLNTKTRMT